MTRWMVLDGLHRLLEAHLCVHATSSAELAQLRDLPTFLRIAAETGNQP